MKTTKKMMIKKKRRRRGRSVTVSHLVAFK